jgi:peptidoglycan hydrolase-like protein with peptidoglycan-binding domain
MSAVSDYPRADRSGSEPAAEAEGTYDASYSAPAGGDAPNWGDGRGRRGRRRRGTYLVAAGALAVALGGTAAAFVVGRGEEQAPARKASTPAATAAITRGDLVDTEAVDGTLTYDDERSVNTRANGVITWLPEEGAEIERGEPLLKVANKPVMLMYGSLPLYRALRQGVSDGRDVQQLERNLKALGYGDDLTVDKEFTAATAAAVKAWQDDAGLAENGAVDASQAVFQPAAVRVSDVQATVGGQASGPPLKVTGTKRLVQVDLDADKQDLVKKGATVTIELPDGEQVNGKIAKVGKVAESSGDGDNPDEEDTPTVDVEVSLSGKGTGNLDKAPVTVNLESERSKDVLSVPVEALLALREGGFGVEVVEGGASRIVAVETGTFGGGRVEITGSGLREGMKVGVPNS